MQLVAPGVWRFRFGRPEKDTPVRHRFFPPAAEAMKALPLAGTAPFDTSAFLFRRTARGCLIEIPMTKDEDVYGFGLQLKSHRQTGKKKTLRVNSDPVADTGDSHAPVPFYLSTAGYGVFVDTARYASFYCGSHQRPADVGETTARRSDEDLATGTDVLYQWQRQKRRSMTIEIPAARGVDVYLFAGPDLRTALRRYVLFSGGGCLPPLWGLGVWYRGSGKFVQKDVVDLAREFRARHMPCDVFGLEPSWQTHTYSCSYVFDNQRFPNSDGLIADMRDMGYNLNLWEHAFVHPTAPFHGRLAALAGDVAVWEGLVPDFSIEETRRVFADYHRERFVGRGVTGFKLDECDNSDFIQSPWSFPEHSHFPGGMDGEQMHSLLGPLYMRTLLEAFAPSRLRTYNSVRSGHGLAAPYPFVLYSDLYDHRDFVRGVVNCGFSGLLWSPEVRQCASVEELIRRLQAVVLSPQALINAWMIHNPPWKQVDWDRNNRHEFMDDWEDVEEACRRILRLRMQLLPYLYAAFARYCFEGIPPFRALVIDWPEDANVRGIDNQYMMGDSLLVAPVFAGQRERQVYLPAGGWYDFWTGTRCEGGREIAVAADLDKIPLYVRENSLLPLAEPHDCVNRDTVFDLTVRVYGEAPPPFRLLVDDGETRDALDGRCGWLDLRWTRAGGGECVASGNDARPRYRVASWQPVAR